MRIIPAYLSKILILFILSFTYCSYGQKETIKIKKEHKNFSIQGLWECYTSANDTLNPNGVQLWYRFENSNMSAILVPTFGMPPEKAGMGTTSKYSLKNDTLTIIGNGKKEQTKITVHHSNFISFMIIGDKDNDRFYLKRVIKK